MKLCFMIAALSWAALSYSSNVPFQVGDAGLSFDDSSALLLKKSSNDLTFKDGSTSVATLKDAVDRLMRKDLDFTNLNNGYVLTWVTASNRFELLPTGGSGSGVTPPFIFSKDGSLSVGTYLRTGSVVTNMAGHIIKGNSRIVEISATNENSLGSTTRIQFQQRTARTTFVDITNAYVDIPSGNYKATRTGLAVNIGPDWEISAYNKSGSSMSNAIVVLYLVPQ